MGDLWEPLAKLPYEGVTAQGLKALAKAIDFFAFPMRRGQAVTWIVAAARFACQQLQLDAMGMQAPAAAGRESSAPWPYMAYISSQWYTRQTPSHHGN